MGIESEEFSLLAEYVINISGLDPGDILFIRLDGSSAGGTASRYSDYDLVVVCRPECSPEKKDFWGIFRDRLVSFWVIGLEEYESIFCEVNENEFLWQVYSSKIARPIFGDTELFNRLAEKMIGREWSEKIQGRAVAFSYGNVVEYLGKMINASSAEAESTTFFFYASQMAHHYAQFIAALNRLNIRSLNTLHDQIFGAGHVPPGFMDDFLVLSGYQESGRSMESTLSSARKIVSWARTYLIEEYGLEKFMDLGFSEMVSSLSYIQPDPV